MNYISNSIISPFQKHPTILTTNIVSWFGLFLMLTIFGLSWATYAVFLLKKDDYKQRIKLLAILYASFSVGFACMIIVYLYLFVKYKVGPSGLEGSFNMYHLYRERGVGSDFWLFVMFIAMLIISVSGFLILNNLENENMVKQLIQVGIIVSSIVSGFWVLYHSYLAINVRSIGLYPIISEMHKASPDTNKLANYFRIILERKGYDIGIDLYPVIKRILQADTIN